MIELLHCLLLATMPEIPMKEAMTSELIVSFVRLVLHAHQ